ncbi:hypothetical protein GLOTRDRAFT_125139 [Gloeophyllum trabeum ATCC 11539]|uniref:Uncharacterized protein n=1 Tax=Gloeophyllum trabeum (strain ATCC 11539 / FP-39264 / Madison 617) TaxID=670483 RepID=S7QHY7_GLOTA|nr:uncharacterized protein GLOTRDRAFT_125139 [Gloeophyllum trabeum ATCC 11539]EPQ58812.1 hypothetical protein GLOTRDRAFT_125139 [Gloeophyllum trabeum ATCC 11539]
MRSIHILRNTPSVIRTLHTRPTLHSTTRTSSGLNRAVSQGHATAPQSVQSVHVAAGLCARNDANDHHLDAASPAPQYRPRSFGHGGGNREGVGFVEQVGGASVSADNFSSVGYMGGKRGFHGSAAIHGGSRMHSAKTVTRGGRDPSVSQGHAADPEGNESPQDVLSDHVGDGMKARDAGHPMDAASSHTQPQLKPTGMGSGNKEHIGFVEQIGGASASANGGSKYMPDDVKGSPSPGSTASARWEGATTTPNTYPRPSLTSALKHTTQAATSTPRPLQWEGKRPFSFTLRTSLPTYASGRTDPHTAGRTQKQKDAHLGLDTGGPAEYEQAKLAGSRFGETRAQKGSVTVGAEKQKRTPGTDRNAESASGDFSNVGVVAGQKEK